MSRDGSCNISDNNTVHVAEQLRELQLKFIINILKITIGTFATVHHSTLNTKEKQ